MSSPAIDHTEPLDGDVTCVFSVDQAMSRAFSGAAEVSRWVVSRIGASEQAGTVIEREGDMALQYDRTDLKIACRYPATPPPAALQASIAFCTASVSIATPSPMAP